MKNNLVKLFMLIIVASLIGIILPNVSFAIELVEYKIETEGWYDFGNDYYYVSVMDDDGALGNISEVLDSTSDGSYKLYAGQTIYLRDDIFGKSDSINLKMYATDSNGQKDVSKSTWTPVTKVKTSNSNQGAVEEPNTNNPQNTQIPETPNNNNSSNVPSGVAERYADKQIIRTKGRAIVPFEIQEDANYDFYYTDETGKEVDASGHILIKTDKGWQTLKEFKAGNIDNIVYLSKNYELAVDATFDEDVNYHFSGEDVDNGAIGTGSIFGEVEYTREEIQNNDSDTSNEKKDFASKVTKVSEDDENVVFTVNENGKFTFWDTEENLEKLVLRTKDGQEVKKKYIRRTNGDVIGVEYELQESVEYVVSKEQYAKLDDTYSTTPKTVNTKSSGPVLFEQVEKMMAYIVRGAANGLVWLINTAVGGENGVTIDDIIFNHYEPTQLLYYEEVKEDSLIHDIIDGIITWSQLFTEIAVMAYLISLLYIGLQILFKSTSSRQAEYKKLLTDWIIGVMLLFAFPLLIKYSIQMNNAFVEEIENAKGKVVESTDGSYSLDYDKEVAEKTETASKIDLSLASDATKKDKKNLGNALDKPAYSSSDTNYMAMMCHKAEETEKLSYAIVYMIMTWQLLMLIIVYYKRLFITGFLIVIFPLAALTYAVDRIKDGQSQAFDRWAREILLNIFLQTFHAIIYVFAINACLAAGNENDWIIMVMGVSFLFKGEEIIKGIFGQKKSESVTSLATAAIRTAAIYTAVTKGANKLKDNFIGRNSHLGKSLRARRESKRYEYMAENFDSLSSTGPEYTPPPASELPHAPSIMDPNDRQLGDAIQTINHYGVASPAKLAVAIGVVQNYSGSHPEMLDDLKIKPGKLKQMQKVKEHVARELDAGTDQVTVEQNIKLELETIFGAKNVDKMAQALYHQMSLPMNSNHIPRNTDRTKVAQELNNAQFRKGRLENSFKFSNTPSTAFGSSKFETEVSDLLYLTFGVSTYTSEQKKMGEAITVIKNRNSGKYGAGFNIVEQVNAMEYVMTHKDDDIEYKKMIKTLGGNVDEMSLALAEKVDRYRSHPTRISTNPAVATRVLNWADATKNHYHNEQNPLKDALQRISILSAYDSKPDNEIIDRVIADREMQNFHEQMLLKSFAKSRVEEEKPRIALLEGMTREELEEMAAIKETEQTEELARATMETYGAVLAAPIGAAAGIAFAETDKGAIAEGIAGAFGGAVVGDQIVAKTMGGTEVKEYKMKNPYTGEKETVKLRVGGAFSQYIYSYNDPALPDEVRGSIKEQFLKTAAAKRRKEAEERMKSYKKANKS